jgi:mRNA-degrading endonuclease RelE of RelBE toxin-antitoxin system
MGVGRLTKPALMTIIRVMMERGKYEIIYATQVHEHLCAIEPKYYSLIRVAIEQQLQFEPDSETRNRKPLRSPGIHDAEWELRFGPNNRFRVFYQVDQQNRKVQILAVGVKERNRVYISGEEFKP